MTPALSPSFLGQPPFFSQKLKHYLYKPVLDPPHLWPRIHQSAGLPKLKQNRKPLRVLFTPAIEFPKRAHFSLSFTVCLDQSPEISINPLGIYIGLFSQSYNNIVCTVPSLRFEFLSQLEVSGLDTKQPSSRFKHAKKNG